MTCPACGNATGGVECHVCGAQLERKCPACEAHYTRACRFCRQCGRDLFFVNYSRSARLKFPVNVLPEAYEYPPDRAGLKLLQRTGPLREASRVFIKQVTEPLLHGQLLGTAVRVSEKQFPLIHRQATICERILNLPPVNIFIGTAPGGVPSVSAFTYGTEDSACIFLTSGLVDALNEEELRFVIGHEMGHIKSRHLLYLTIANMITMGLSARTSVLSQVVVGMLGQLLAPWQRKAEITADRAGLLCCQNVHTAVSAMVKVSLGARKLFDQLDFEEYMKQYDTLKANYRWSESQESHPYVIHRVHLLRNYAASPDFRQLLQSAYDPTTPKILCHRCQTYEYVTDVDRKLAEVACSTCHAVLSIAGIYCPHCHAYVKVTDPNATLGSFRCQPAADEAKHRRLGVHYCGKGYFEGLPTPVAAPPESHYDVLGIPESATERDVERAYLSVVKPTLKPELEKSGEPLTFDAIQRRIKAQSAFQVLTDRNKRAIYNQRLALMRALHRERGELGLTVEPEKLPLCVRCEEPVYGPYCTQCGVNQEEALKQSQDLAKALEDVAAALNTQRADGSPAATPPPAPPADPAPEDDSGVMFVDSGEPEPEDPGMATGSGGAGRVRLASGSSWRGDDPNIISASEAIE